MSWFDDLVDAGSNLISGVSNFFGSNSLGSNLLKTAMTGFALNQVTKSINKSNDTTTKAPAVDPGVRVQTRADTEYKIPVLYGRAVFGGSLVDARMTTDNTKMYYVYALCENTGTKLSDSAASVISFNDVYWNDERIVFQGDGITANYTVDRNGKVNRKVKDLVKVYLYRKGSSTQVFPSGYTGTTATAYSIVPDWTSSWTMNNLAFAIVEVTYNKDKGITGVGTMKFDVSNTMDMPGDVLYDLMTNGTYGAAIAEEEIYGA